MEQGAKRRERRGGRGGFALERGGVERGLARGGRGGDGHERGAGEGHGVFRERWRNSRAGGRAAKACRRAAASALHSRSP
ncbi:MAG: hypothetical protein EA420_09275 [Candidatus Competibacteraceae bacterium]|nr:MAG: hypothetical protein EA420_09275 [Candidatus Competibacteraceae bacterium]